MLLEWLELVEENGGCHETDSPGPPLYTMPFGCSCVRRAHMLRRRYTYPLFEVIAVLP